MFQEVRQKSNKTIVDVARHPVLRKRFLILALHWWVNAIQSAAILWSLFR